jgi:hypothetical protein
MSARQHFVKVDGHYQLNAAASLLILGHYAFEDFGKVVPEPPNKLRDIVGQVLAMATAGGFAQSDILLTILSKHEQSSRMLRLAQEVIDHMGGDDLFVEFMRNAREAQNCAQ